MRGSGSSRRLDLRPLFAIVCHYDVCLLSPDSPRTRQHSQSSLYSALALPWAAIVWGGGRVAALLCPSGAARPSTPGGVAAVQPQHLSLSVLTLHAACPRTVPCTHCLWQPRAGLCLHFVKGFPCFARCPQPVAHRGALRQHLSYHMRLAYCLARSLDQTI